jgi:hypothetical protein
MKMKQQGFTALELLVVIFWIVAIAGWVMNIVSIAGSNFNDITGLLVLRVVGIFVSPLGAVLGYF